MHKLKLPLILILHGQLINWKNVALQNSTFLEIIVYNVLLHYFGIQFLEDANLVPKITFIIQLLKDASVRFHAMPQDNTILQQDNVNVQQIKKVPKEFGVILIKVANVHHNFHYGMESIVLFALKEQNLTKKKNNATNALMDSSETKKPKIAYQDFE